MLITFKSRTGADVLMLGDSGQKLLAVLGKDASDPRGILTAEQLPAAIARLKAAIAEEKARATPKSATTEEAEREAGHTGMAAPVSLAQRAWPLLDLCERALADNTPVTWGV
jgi:erythromycin esterase-like protein